MSDIMREAQADVDRVTAADRGQRALAERLPPIVAWPATGEKAIAMARRNTAAVILGEHGVYLPDGRVLTDPDFPLHTFVLTTELERLLKVEAAARLVLEVGNKASVDALRAALATDGAET